jgi:hypothetical protein
MKKETFLKKKRKAIHKEIKKTYLTLVKIKESSEYSDLMKYILSSSFIGTCRSACNMIASSDKNIFKIKRSR